MDGVRDLSTSSDEDLNLTSFRGKNYFRGRGYKTYGGRGGRG